MTAVLSLLALAGLVAGARQWWLLRQAKRLGEEVTRRKNAEQALEAKNAEAKIHAAPARTDEQLSDIVRRHWE